MERKKDENIRSGSKRQPMNTYLLLLLMRTDNIPTRGPILKFKATEYAKELKIETFKASNGWLDKRKHR